ncbi:MULTISPECIES: hypothetical protein [Streptomyces]|uniref:Secreted protein n=1 Tax=Streptomyces solicathayae TaxID=3081768 RepID=A0ABZ0LXT7_9ACTN|nr:hypothetical protein [Streptomyces sp. HUAS YS2]WOX24324.1 hypothetical protein R2D22_24265 [Streptomyces sp. HUAS YS2]
MQRRTTRLGALAAGAVTALLAGGTAQGSAYYVYHGSDFGYISTDHSYVRVCDREVDGFNVYSDYTRLSGATGRVEETGGYCRSGGSAGSAVYRLRTCENYPFAPDSCSGWKEHY